MEATEIVVYLTPIIVFFVAQLVKLIKQAIPGYVITVFIVPLISLAYAYISQLAISPDVSFFFQALYGLGAVFVYELYKDLKGAK